MDESCKNLPGVAGEHRSLDIVNPSPQTAGGVISKPHAVVAIRQWLECNSLEGEPQQLKSTGTASEKSHVTDTFDDIKYYLSGVGTV